MNRRTEVAIYAVSALLLTGAAAIWWQGIRPAPAADLEPLGVVEEATGRSTDEPEDPITIFVHIAGAVQKPGVYELPEGERLFTALEAVGLAEDADLSSLNLASVLRDSQKVYVPVIGEELSSPPAGSGGTGYDPGRAPPTAFPINVNTATKAELELLPGIGPVLASSIIARREQVGPFRRPEDLKSVSGIGDKTYERIAPYVTVR